MAKGLPEWCQTHSFKEFLELLEEGHCPYCKAYPLIKLKRQYIHRVGYKNIICIEKGLKPNE
jgi:hypothetical protein